MTELSHFLFHMDDWLQQVFLLHPLITYLLISFILFTESAFFPAAPFLPGDGLLFSIGVLAAGNSFNLWVGIPVLIAGGISGTGAAFLLGRKFGLFLFKKFPKLNQNHYSQAHQFYQKHGNMAFLLSRFMPVIRALIPLVAGIAKMDKSKFWRNNIGSVTVWVVLITLAGYKLGHLPFVKHYFGAIILGISAITLISVTLIGLHQQFRKGK